MSSIDKVRIIVAGDSGNLQVDHKFLLVSSVLPVKIKFYLIADSTKFVVFVVVAVCRFEYITVSVIHLFSGCGKSSFVHLIANNEVLTSPSFTVGCNVEVKLHNYKEETSAERPFFVELFDVGGSIGHKNTRSVFYNQANGIILVHDMTNRKSQENLKHWLVEILNKDGKDTKNSLIDTEIDPEQFLGSAQVSHQLHLFYCQIS